MNNHINGSMPGSQTHVQHRNRRSHHGSISNKHPQSDNGALPMPVGGQRPHGVNENGNGMLGAARSPPKNKNTSHVPCKFYLSGQCQAGRMCPFSHDLESTTRPAPCKYFAKGHCKFGAKCALLHITPDGTVVNRRHYPPAPFPANGQSNGYGPPPEMLSLQAQGLDPQSIADPAHEFGFPFSNGQDMPHFDYTNASPTYGSPPQDHSATSPPRKGLSVLDAPLPNSFDSNGISLAARHGPFAASVPSRFGIDSPPSSVPRKNHLGNHALQELHNSAFGDSTLDSMLAGASPPSGDELLTFPKRSLYSERLRASRQVFSASVGTRMPPQQFEYSDDEGDLDQEENLLPASLRDLIPESRSRRASRAAMNDESPASFLAAQRRTLSSNTTPQESKVGSPSFSSSPSRYSGMFAQRSASSDFVGSPLRNSGFPSALSSSATQLSELGLAVNSPPRQASMSMLTQGLQRTRIDQARSQVNGTSHTSAPVRQIPNASNGRTSLDRAISSTSIGRERIDEEQELFDMDEIGSSSRPQSSSASQAGISIGSRLYGSNGREETNHGAIGSQRSK
ncbi:hypothetical protein AMS68_001847 [Peltaster fructicola]|uniref:C3H1-type domain-containing protein n=1 Tax=Peltaster fructicola TaxID=286661 RepID=A0A6H0XPC1_9PEZI|nr:hypothetical protein AMS68_001847 [Peltaster fructicola]